MPLVYFIGWVVGVIGVFIGAYGILWGQTREPKE
jgi:hypothetical protein